MRFDEVLAGVRAILAKELVAGYGFSRKRAAEILKLSQPAITLYLNGKRAFDSSRKISENLIARRYVEGLLEKILLREDLSESELYDAAFSLWRILEAEGEKVEVAPEREEDESSRLLKSLRERVQAEQESAEEFMRVAASLKDDLIRMIFRMIASDCIRHADTLMTLISAIEREEMMDVDQLKSIDLAALLEKEEKAHIGSLDEVKKLLPSGLASILVELIQDDERKHSKILKGIMDLVKEARDL